MPDKVKFPAVEMHTAHVYQGDKLLIVGGRGMYSGQSVEQIAFHNAIFTVDLKEGETYGQVAEIGTLPSDLAAHQSALVDDKYLIVYGGFNGLRFFDSILRYDIAEKKWTLMLKQPSHCKDSRFFRFGRISSSSLCLPDVLVLFGGSSFDQDNNDFLVLPLSHLRDDANFSEINEIM